MVIGNPDAVAAAAAANTNTGGGASANSLSHPSGIPQDKIDNIMSGIANTGDVKMNNHRKKLRQRFDIIKKLGQGTYGKVQLGINKETGQEVAIKTIKKCKIEAEADLVRIRREVQIMSSVQHPNIIHIYEVFENREKMVLVMEFAAGGELYDYLSERKVLSEEEARRIFRQVATAVYYCHKHKICHRDLKLENILLDEQGNAKIADFGLSNVFDDQRLLATFCGSPLYASPEIVEGTPYHGPEVDCWSLGVLLYTLVYGSMPFDGSNFKRLVKQISQGDYYEPKKPSRASSLIRDMLTVCPRKRATIEQICSHWWVNENDNVSCLDLAEDLANQTPVRLDVLLSLTPAAVTADQLVVPSADGGAAGKGGERVPRSHSVGSIRDIGAATEAERRILDMVAAGGEAALMPSPTRTITPAQSPVQSKRKLETTVSMENAAGSTVKKKEKPGSNSLILDESSLAFSEDTPMEIEEESLMDEPSLTRELTKDGLSSTFSQKDMELVGDLCEKLIQDKPASKHADSAKPTAQKRVESESAVAAVVPTVPRQRTVGKLDSVEEAPEEKDAAKVIKQFVNKHKTADLVNAIGQIAPEKASNEAPAPTTTTATTPSSKAANTTSGTAPPPFVRKCSLQDESQLNKFNAERRKSRILETAEKFQQMNAGNGVEKPKKLVIPGVSVGTFKKEFERKASTAPVQSGPTAGELRAMEQVAAAAAAAQELENVSPPPSPCGDAPSTDATLEASDSKTSVTSLSLEEARRSMENSIALLRQAQHESTKDVDQLCAKTENIEVSDDTLPSDSTGPSDRERKLKNARAIIGNAIQPVIRRPLPPPSLSLYGIGVGMGGGGHGGYGAQMRAASSGGFMGYSGGSSSGSGSGSTPATPSPPIYAAQQPIPQQLHTQQQPATVAAAAPPLAPILASNAANVALAAARQNIMERLAATTATTGGGQQYAAQQNTSLPHSTAINSFARSPLHTNSPTPTAQPSYISTQPSLYSQLKLQQQQQLQQQQKQQMKPQYHNHHHHLHHNHSHSQYQKQQQRQKHLSHPPPIQLLSYAASAARTPASAAAAANAISNARSTTTTATTSATTIATISNSVPKPFYNAPSLPSKPTTPSSYPYLYSYPSSTSLLLKSSPGGDPNAGQGTVKTSTASITLKSATLPRRKTAKTEIQLDIKPRIAEQPQPQMHFTTEMQHPVPDLRSAPAREGPLPYSPIKTTLSARATSLEPKEHIIPIQRPQTAYSRTTSNTTNRSGSLSRQSTVDSESDTTTTTNMSQATITGSSQPIKKSPREFIIPIAMEGGGFITPREGSIEPSESSHTTTSSRTTFSRLRPARRIGSLLSEAGVDEGSPFQNMRTTSINRDGDDDTRFTLHRLRSSRPVKKISQDNDSQSSGEEDDDDGFEILTAENLFSTLLQRVRALTNRLNVNNDLTAGFPNSSRLLSNMRQAQSPFWNQEPFGRSQVSYSYSQTVEKKHVRLNNAGHNLGAPWRHSMSRDLGSDMESMFSRTGATLPRGSKTVKNNRSSLLLDTTDGGHNANASPGAEEQRAANTEEPLDLADLDLSRLRLSKKDLETLSSIAPGLPKCFQEQLLAKLPPTQARKLSRTLSLQQGSRSELPTVKVCQRSQSGGRPTLQEPAPVALLVPTPDELKEHTLMEEVGKAGSSGKGSDDSSERTLRPSLHRRSLSRSRYDYETPAEPTQSAELPETAARNSRSSSVCRDDYGKSLCSTSTYTSDVNEKYKYYSPYLSKSIRDYSSSENSDNTSSLRRFGNWARPPSGCLSPPPSVAPMPTLEENSSSLRRRSSQRNRTSRFLRPDFFDELTSPALPENAYQREKRLREREAQSVLREIREKSREPSRERPSTTLNSLNAPNPDRAAVNRKHSLPNDEAPESTKAVSQKHVRNKSMEVYESKEDGTLNSKQEQEAAKRHRRSLSRPRDISAELDKHELADKILQELQLLSAVRSQQEKRLSMPREISVERSTEIITQTLPKRETTLAEDEEPALDKERTGTIKKVKKVKPKEKSADAANNPTEGENLGKTTTTTTVVRKIRKIVKKSETNASYIPENTGISAAPRSEELQIPIEVADESPKKESKLKRPKSYPTKELAVGNVSPKIEVLPSKLPLAKQSPPTIPESQTEPKTVTPPRESRLVRPKSYPASKLLPPKDTKKTTRSGIAIASIVETTDQKSSSVSGQSTGDGEEKSPKAKYAVDSSIPNESRPTSFKKIIKGATKKSKLVQPTPITPTSTPSSTTTATTSTTASSTADEDSKESSPTVRELVKEKSPEKKHSKGLLYAIGQKFEKFRDSAMHKDKKSALGVTTLSSTNAPNTVTSKSLKSSPDDSSPEKIKEKTTLLHKRKSTKTDKSAATASSQATTTATATATKTAPKPTTNGDADKSVPKDKRSRIDAMIRSLRERSVPRSQAVGASESNYIKRAVSVEQMPGTFNRNAVNKVLGLFKRFEKESSGGERRTVRSTRSTSNIERQLHESDLADSPIYQNKAAIEYANRQQQKKKESLATNDTSPCGCELGANKVQPISCPDCVQDQVTANKRRTETPKSRETESVTPKPSTELLLQGNRDKRKALMLDFSKLDQPLESSTNSASTQRSSKASTATTYINGNGIYSNLPPYPGAIQSSSNNSSSQQSFDNTSNNNNNNNNNSCLTNNNNSSSMHTSQTSGYRTSSAHEINRNHLLTPSNENIANYSSDSRSYQDDCASTSTFLSPTDEPELYFDNWSICSEDNYRLHATPSPTVSRLSRASQLSSPTRGGESSDPNESVIDRIKRRSFYCRFNEKKPKRTSSIVGPSAVRDYYREQQASVKARSSNKISLGGERVSSPDITTEFLRPLKLSPVGTELKPPIYRGPHDYGKSRKSLNDIRPHTSTSPSFLTKRFGSTATENEYLSLSATVPSRFKSSSSSSPYESNGAAGSGSSYYSTYNPKRRSSYTLNGTLPSGGASSHLSSSHIDGYATVGRRASRPYDQRTLSLLDPSSSASTSSYRREARTPIRDYTSSISRSNSRYRTSSTSRSPTNI